MANRRSVVGPGMILLALLALAFGIITMKMPTSSPEPPGDVATATSSPAEQAEKCSVETIDFEIQQTPELKLTVNATNGCDLTDTSFVWCPWGSTGQVTCSILADKVNQYGYHCMVEDRDLVCRPAFG